MERTHLPHDDPVQQREIIERQFMSETDLYNHTARLGERRRRLARINGILDAAIDLELLDAPTETS